MVSNDFVYLYPYMVIQLMYTNQLQYTHACTLYKQTDILYIMTKVVTIHTHTHTHTHTRTQYTDIHIIYYSYNTHTHTHTYTYRYIDI